MPIYEYLCESCERLFTQLRTMSEHREPGHCPICAGIAPRVMATAPRLNALRDSLRKAHEINERSAHEPGVSNGHRCSASCNHQKPKQQVGKRPWMIGH